MTRIKILMVGLGSIGSRHLVNLTATLHGRGQAYSIDALRSTLREPMPDICALLDHQFYDARQLSEEYDIAFITNPTSMHYETMQLIAGKSRHMFIEKPVFDRCDYDLDALRLREDGVYYVACPLRYTRVMQHLRNITAQECIYSARAICSTYLPDWRRHIDYRETYSARSELGGGVSIDLIHEWDYICYLFGLPQSVSMRKGIYSHLEITSDDLALYIGEYQDKLISIHLDYFGRYARREIELYTADDVILGDLVHHQIRYLKSGKVIQLPEERDACHCAEIEYFLDIVAGHVANNNSIDQALQILKIAKGMY